MIPLPTIGIISPEEQEFIHDRESGYKLQVVVPKTIAGGRLTGDVLMATYYRAR